MLLLYKSRCDCEKQSSKKIDNTIKTVIIFFKILASLCIVILIFYSKIEYVFVIYYQEKLRGLFLLNTIEFMLL